MKFYKVGDQSFETNVNLVQSDEEENNTFSVQLSKYFQFLNMYCINLVYEI